MNEITETIIEEKRKVGRPAKLGEKRTKNFKVLLSPSEHYIISEKAKKLDLASADFLRRLALDYKIKNSSQTEKEILSELKEFHTNFRRIGNYMRGYLENNHFSNTEQDDFFRSITETEEEIKKCVKKIITNYDRDRTDNDR